MDDLYLQRLYLLYKAGSVVDGNKNSDLLQVAKGVGNNLTEEEFAWLAEQVERLNQERDSRAEEKNSTVGIERIGEKQWNISQSGKSTKMSNKEYQARLWELPDSVRSDKTFMPTRSSKGEPVDIDPNDPKGTQSRLQALKYSDVKHDPRLRDAWHAAQNGSLAELLKGGDLWASQTDPKEFTSGATASSKANLTGPLKSLLASVDRGELEPRLQMTANSIGKSLPTYNVYKQEPEKVVQELMAFGSQGFLGGFQHYAFTPGADDVATKTPFKQVFADRNEEDVRKWVHEIREHHEMKVRQELVNYQTQGYRATVAKQAAEASELGSVAQAAAGASSAAMPQIKNEHKGAIPPILKPDELRATVASQASTDADSSAKQAGQSPVASAGSGIMDGIQSILDVVGVADPTPITDGANAGLSLARAALDPKNAGKHLGNAAISAVSMIPYAGDFAKLFKIGGKTGKAMEGIGKVGKVANEYGFLSGDLAKHAPGGGFFGGRSGGPHSSGVGGGAGGGGNGEASAAGDEGGGFNWKSWLPGAFAGGAVVAGASQAYGMASGVNRQMQPMEYSADKWENATGALSRFKDGMDTIIPKWTGLGLILGSATNAMKSWLGWFQKIDEVSNKMLESNRELSKFSGTLALAYTQLDAARLRREMTRAQDLSGPLKGLSSAQNSFEAKKQDLLQPIEKIQITIQTWLTNIATGVLEIVDYVEPITEIVQWWYGDQAVDKNAASAFQRSMQIQAEQQAKENKLNRGK